MYVSFDDGEHWQTLQQNLPVTSVRDIDVHGDDVVIATHGRGFWIMDDVTRCGRSTRPCTPTATVLFKPADGVPRAHRRASPARRCRRTNRWRPIRPDGAYIDYALPHSVRGPVALDVLDAQGRLVRSYSSNDKPPMLDPAKLAYAPEWVPRPIRLVTTPGMHRFVWDLHCTAPAGIESEQGPAQGVWAPPGAYSVVLHVDGKSYRQPLQLLPDPRVKVSVDAMRREFALARQVEGAQVRAAAASAKASKLLKALDARLPQSGNQLHAQIEALIGNTQDLSGVVLHPDPRNSMGSPPQNTGSLRALSMNLAKLEQAVDGADADPSADAQSAWTLLSQTLDTTLASWDQLQQNGLGKLNDSLKANGRKPIVL